MTWYQRPLTLFGCWDYGHLFPLVRTDSKPTEEGFYSTGLGPTTTEERELQRARVKDVECYFAPLLSRPVSSGVCIRVITRGPTEREHVEIGYYQGQGEWGMVLHNLIMLSGIGIGKFYAQMV